MIIKIITLIGVLLTLPVFYGFYLRSRYKKTVLCLAILLNSLLLTLASVLVLNKPAYIPPAQIEMMYWLKEYCGRSKLQHAEKFIDSNLIIIDNAYDISLIDDPSSFAGDSSFISITSRDKLLKVLTLLDSARVDMVVCDIRLDDYHTHTDTLIRNRLLSLDDRLILSINPYDERTGLISMPGSTYGDITQEAKQGQYLSQRLIRGSYPGLPYLLYQKIHDIKSDLKYTDLLIETDTGSHTSYALNEYLPEFSFGDSSLKRSFSEENPNYFKLGECIDGDNGSNQSVFLQAIEKRKQQGLKNIVFIGTISGNEDLHYTAYGPMHGPTILLNVFYQLCKGENKVRPWSLLLVLLCFVIIHLFMVHSISEHGKPSKHGLLHHVCVFLIEELYLFVLWVMTAICFFVTGYVLNLIILTIYFLAIEHIALYLTHRVKPRHHT